jgi:hypothetical protein
MKNDQRLAESFRDPSGFLFKRDGTLFRQVNRTYANNFNYLETSKLSKALSDAGLLIPHKIVEVEPADPDQAYKVLQPELLDFVSYPYEWSFGQWKDAALTTLDIQRIAFEHGMVLKDASAYNIQFHQGRPILIDTLSFEISKEGEPWIAYRQFCQHFLAPLALMSYSDIRLGQLLRVFIDGIPLDLASRLLPRRTWFNLNILSHLHVHALSQRHFANREISKTSIKRSVSSNAMFGLVDSLRRCVLKLSWNPSGTEWMDYYEDSSSYSEESMQHKEKLVQAFLIRVQPASVWDIGANTGRFSRLSSQQSIPTVAFDIDHGAVELNYLESKRNEETKLLPLVMDFTNPSSFIGWNLTERMSILGRGPVDMVLALALVHHLAISNNVPLGSLAHFFRGISQWLVIEFVPKEDRQVQRLLRFREDIFSSYTVEQFEETFAAYFRIHTRERIHQSQRMLYLMEALPFNDS